MQIGGVGGLAAALLGGFLFSFSPSAVAAIPLALAYVTRARSRQEGVIFAAALCAGLLTTHVLLGVMAAWGGASVQQLVNAEFGAWLGVLLIPLGMVWTGWLPLTLPTLPWRGRQIATLGGAFLLGLPLTLGICAACSPGLWISLGASAAIASPSYGALLLLAFGVGRSLPLLVGAWSLAWLEHRQSLAAWEQSFRRIGGISMIVVGLYLLNHEWHWL